MRLVCTTALAPDSPEFFFIAHLHYHYMLCRLNIPTLKTTGHVLSSCASGAAITKASPAVLLSGTTLTPVCRSKRRVMVEQQLSHSQKNTELLFSFSWQI